MLPTLEQARARLDDVIAGGIYYYNNSCVTWDYELFLAAGLAQVFHLDFRDHVDQYTSLISEEEVEQKLIENELEVCPQCNWWCDDCHHYHPDHAEGVCSDCEEECEE